MVVGFFLLPFPWVSYLKINLNKSALSGIDVNQILLF